MYLNVKYEPNLTLTADELATQSLHQNVSLMIASVDLFMVW